MEDADTLKIIIDRETCIGDGACINDAPETFELDDEDIAVLKNPIGDDRETIVEAACNCPVDAIMVEDTATGEQLYP